MLKKSDLHAYQLHCVEHILRTPRCALFLEMGLGKTISTLTAIEELMYQRRNVQKVLVVAPLRVALHTWQSEAEKWEHTRKLTFSSVLGTRKEREEALEVPADIYIINIDNLLWLIEYYGKRWDFDMIVLDESSAYKSHSTKRFKTLKKFAPFFRSRLVQLTGTPSPNTLMDLWSQVYLLDGGARLGQYITHFRNLYFTPDKYKGHIVYSWRLRPGAEQAIYSRIGDLCISMQSRDYLTLPDVRYVDVPIHLTASEQKKYKTFRQEMVLEYAPDRLITASNAATLSGKLRQYSGGSVYQDDSDKWVEVNTAKLERLLEILQEIQTPVLIAYEYRHELERLKKALPKAHTIDEPGIIDAWNAGQVPILLGHPQSMGHGLNLQAGGHTLIWYTLTWSLEYYQQMNARLARQGQTHKVSIYHLITEGSIDSKVLKALQRKDLGQEALMHAVKAELQAV